VGWPWDLDLSNLGDFLDWLGYTEAFCQFCRKGWFLAMFGTVSLIVAACVMDRSLQRRRIVQSIRLMATVGLAGTIVAWSLPLVTGVVILQAQKALQAGRVELAMTRLETAARLMPVLRHDTSFIAQIGKLGYLLGSDRVETQLYKATLMEGEGRFFESNQLYRMVIRDEPVGAPAHREACRALLRDAIDSLNAGRIGAAENELRDVLADEPTNLKAIYTLQLVYLRSGRADEIEPLSERFDRIYSFFQTPVKDAVLSFSHSTDLAAALDDNDPAAARRAFRRTIKP
jgi:tetratricopeptide (TPR) repeat protein